MSKEASKLQMIVFDFFGVLCSDLVDEWIKRRGLESRASTLRDTFVRPADLGVISFDDLCQGLGASLKLGGATVRGQLLDLAVIDFDTVHLLNELSTSSRTAICSNAPRGLVDTIIAERSISLSCDIKLSSADIGVVKPDAAIYQKVLDLAQCRAGNAIMIDDRPANISGAEAVGMAGLQFTSASHLRKQLGDWGLV